MESKPRTLDIKSCGAVPDPDVYPCKELTERIIGCAIRVHRTLGPGFLESIYENALSHELAKCGMKVERQKVVQVFYDGVKVGEHRIDLLVDDQVVLELKSAEVLTNKHSAQTISTLKAAGAKVALLLNFDEAQLTKGMRRYAL